MSDNASPAKPAARLWTPSARWRDHIFAFISRDTRGCDLAPHERFNRFPATSYCTLTWFFEGEVELLSCGGRDVSRILPRCSASGCMSRPILSRNRGDGCALMVMFYPDVFHALFGIDAGRLQDNFLDAQGVLPPHGQALVEAVFAAADDEARHLAVEAFMEQHAHAIRISAWTRMHRMGARVTLQLASTALGVGPRQSQRLALREMGVNLQTLGKLWRAERAFVSAQRQRWLGKKLILAEHAIDTGYADQSHFARECKAVTGRTPVQLRHDVLHEEADWVYRLEFPSYGHDTSSRSA